MDLNFPAEGNESLCAGVDERSAVEENKGSVEEVLVHGLEEDKERDVEEEGKVDDKEEGKENGVSDMEEGKEVKAGGFIKRASRRKSCQLAKEKIERLNDDFYEWEDEEKTRRGPKRKRKGVKSEDNGGETVGEQKNGEDQEKPRTGRKRKGVKSEANGGETLGEEKNGEDQEKPRRGRKRKGVKSEANGGEAVGENKNGEDQEKPRRGRKRKVVKSENNGGEDGGEGKNGEDDCPKRTRGRRKTLINGEEEEVEGEKCAGGIEEGGEGGYSLRTSRDKQDNAARRKGRKKLEENGKEIEPTSCHQCQRNDKGRVVRCTKCTTRRYCMPCMTRWYGSC